MYENSKSTAVSSAAASSTPVFDALLVEFRANFRTVPGEPWAPLPVPRFADLSVSGGRFGLPPGPGGI